MSASRRSRLVQAQDRTCLSNGQTGPEPARPATLVYLSLRALAAEPGLWARFHKSDSLLVKYENLTNGTSGEVWGALAASPDPDVRALTGVVVRWLGG